jgi:hypothetical protein
MDAYRQDVSSMSRTVVDARRVFEWTKGYFVGLDDGQIRARRHILISQLEERFGEVPLDIVAWIECTTDAKQFERWLKRILTASTLKQMRISPPQESARRRGRLPNITKQFSPAAR